MSREKVRGSLDGLVRGMSIPQVILIMPLIIMDIVKKINGACVKWDIYLILIITLDMDTKS